MAVGAFKTKYTGQQMEELFDKLSASSDDNSIPTIGEGQYCTTEISSTYTLNGNWFKGQTIETNFGTLTYTGLHNASYGGCTNILSLLTTDTSEYVSRLTLNDPITLTYTFKKPVTLLRYRCGGNGHLTSVTKTLYYWINNTWINQGTMNVGTTNLTPQTIEKVKIEFSSNGNCALYYSIFDFMSDSYIISGPAIKDVETTEG